MVRKAEEVFGRVDVLVNNYAAPIPGLSFEESTWETWQEQIDYTVKAAFFCSKGA